MSANLPSLNVAQYSTNVSLLLQQKGSKLRGTVTEGTYVGEQGSPVDQIGSVEMQEVTARFAPMGRVDATVDRRWCFPTDSDLPQLIDTYDKLRLIIDPESAYVQNAVLAAGRKIDATIISAFFGTAKTGKAGATSTAYTTGNTITVSQGGTNSRINVEKLVQLKEKMQSQFVDFDSDEVYIGITAKDHGALLREIQVVSSDFNAPVQGSMPVLMQGKITQFLGFNFVHCELIESLSTATNKCLLPAWAKTGMHIGLWNDITSNVSQRNDLQGEPWQLYTKLSCGATRIEENKVYQIESYR